MTEKSTIRRLGEALVVLGIVGLLGVGVLVISIRLERDRPLTLPTPTGAFSVGRTISDWVDDAMLDTLAPVPGAKRELLAWIWYPADSGPRTVTDDYLPAEMRAAVERARGPLIGGLLTRDLANVHAHSLRDADVSRQTPSYPVVILRGGASAEVWNYTSLAEDLASHGYVVVGFDAPYRTNVVAFPDGRVVRRTPANNPELAVGAPDSAKRIDKVLDAWTGDVGFALDRLEKLNTPGSSSTFAGRLDLSRVGIFGHSLGGATAAEFCAVDSRCKAGVDVDGALLGSVIRDGIHRPFMFLLSDHGDTSEVGSRQIMADIQSVYGRLPPRERARVAIRGASHFLFSDDGALLKSHIVLRTLRLAGIVGIDGRRQLAATSYCLRTFFDAHLEGVVGSPLGATPALFPEIQVLP